MKKNRFEEHSRKILVGVLVVSLFFAVFGVELLLPLITRDEKTSNETRYIRLREHKPSTITYEFPGGPVWSESDSLVKKEYRIEIDKDGYIYPSRIHEQPDITIIFLGGSTTECMFVDEKNRFPYLVGRLLEEEGKKVNSFNSGVAGNHSMHSIDILLNKGLELRPDVAILMQNINDLNILLYETNYWNKNPDRSLLAPVSNNLWKNMKGAVEARIPRLYKRLATLKKTFHGQEDEFALLRGKKLHINKQEIIKKFERSLLTFIAICKANGIVPVLMTQANRFKEKPDTIIINSIKALMDFGITYDEYKDIYDAMNDLIRKVGTSNMVLVIDLAKSVPQENVYMSDAVHFNDNGSKYVARLIADRLNEMFNKSHNYSD